MIKYIITDKTNTNEPLKTIDNYGKLTIADSATAYIYVLSDITRNMSISR